MSGARKSQLCVKRFTDKTLNLLCTVVYLISCLALIHPVVQTSAELTELECGLISPELQPRQLDLFERDNLNKVLKGVISAIAKLTPEDSEGGKYEHFKEILANTDVMNTLVNVCECIDDLSLDASSKQVQVALRLKNAEKALERAGLQEHYFYGFISSMRNAYKVLVYRQVADEIIEKYRGEIEKKMGTESASTSVSANASANIEGIEVGVGFGASASEGVHEKNFYRTTSGFSFDLSAGFAVPHLASLTANDKVEFSRALIYRSLEQFLDTDASEGKISSLRVRSPKINKVAKARSEMQAREKEALSTVATSIEPYLKILGIISQDTKIALPTITKAQTATREKTLQNTIGLSAATKALTDAGLKVSADAGVNVGVSQTSVRHAYLSLIDEDCFPDVGVSSKKLAEYLKADEFKKFNEVEGLLRDAGADDVESLAKTITGNLRDYNWSLSVLANENASISEKYAAKERERAIEKDWLSTLHKSRLNMLKAGISLAATLRTSTALKDNEMVKESFKELYSQLVTLSKMQTFTKGLSSSKKSAEFSTKHTSKFAGVNASLALNIPGFKASEVDISYVDTRSELEYNSGKDLTFSVKVPIVNGKIVGTKIVRETLEKVQLKLQASNQKLALIFADGIKILSTKFEPTIASLGYDIISVVNTNFLRDSAAAKKYITISFYLTSIPAFDMVSIPLPGQKLYLQPQNPWTLKIVKTSVPNGLNFSLPFEEVDVSACATVSRSSAVIGTDSLSFPISRFNAFAASLKDSAQKKEVSELWTIFKNGQASQFKEIFKNISQSGSNVRYELQCMYNRILTGVNSKSKLNLSKRSTLKRSIESIFEGLLTSCYNFSRNDSEENFSKASQSLDRVLKLNFENRQKTESCISEPFMLNYLLPTYR